MDPIEAAPKVAWIMPSLERAGYWQPIFYKFTKLFKNTVIFTGDWKGYVHGFEDQFAVVPVGKSRFIVKKQLAEGYSHGFIYLSPTIVFYLIKQAPDIIFANGFSLWTLIALLLKPFCRWKVVIALEGSSPNVDFLDDPFRIRLRRWMCMLTDAFISNSTAGGNYLKDTLGARKDRVFVRPYEVPFREAMSKFNDLETASPAYRLTKQKPLFLYIGQIIPRKGIDTLIHACSILTEQGVHDFHLAIVGDGEQLEELKELSQQKKLQDNIEWAGWIEYSVLKQYWNDADVFVMPTLEDTWGMVILESMAFGKPVICSRMAGASELIEHGVNGYLINPLAPSELAEIMMLYIRDKHLSSTMGDAAQKTMENHSVDHAIDFFKSVTDFVLHQKSIKIQTS